MARKGFIGFEEPLVMTATVIGASDTWYFRGFSADSGSPTIDSTIFRPGGSTKSFKVSPSSGAPAAGYTFNTTSQKDIWITFWVRFTVLPATTARSIFGSPGINNVYLTIAPTGAILVVDRDGSGVETTRATSTQLLNDTSRWYKVDWFFASVAKTVTLYIDNVLEANAVSVPNATAATQNFFLGCEDNQADTYTAYFDDLIADDANRVTTDSHVITMFPTSDNTRGTWTGGAGGTTNLWDAVNNSPPVGVASASATNTSQIESGSNSGTDEYRAGFQTYEAAGVTGRLLNVAARIHHGEDIATGTKTGTLTVLSSPAQGATNSFTFGDDVGAIGTWSANWRSMTTSVVDASATAVTASPVVAIRKTDTTTRVASVTAAFLMVEFEPKSYPHVYVLPSQAVQRAANW